MPPPHHMMRNEPEYAQDVVKTFRRLLGLLRGQRRQVCLLLPSLLIIMVTELAWPSILGDVIDTLAQAPVAWRRVIFLLVRGDAARAAEVPAVLKSLRLGEPLLRSKKPVH